MPDRVRVEICLSGVASAVEAERGGADRVELCENLRDGGVTPSYGTIAAARARLGIGLMVIIRPRGGDFVYGELELEVIEHDIRAVKSLGADGVVLGLLDREGRIDTARTRRLVDLARPLSVTFHRAFDFARDADEALDDLIALGVDRVLTSGQEATAPAGALRIAELIRRARDRIVILPGGGVSIDNCAALVAATGAREVHLGSSTQELIEVPGSTLSRVALGPGGQMADDRILRTSAAKVRSVVTSLERRT
jgi:copper homeostasis protein